MIKAEDVIPLITAAIGTAVERRYTPGVKLAALSYARDQIISITKPEKAYAPDQLLTFIDRKADLPTGYLVWVKMFNPTNPDQEYYKVDINDFDTAPSGNWTIKKDPNDLTNPDGSPKERIHFSDDTVSAMLRFIDVLDPLSSTENYIQLHVAYKEALAYFSAAKILSDDERFNEGNDRLNHAFVLTERATAVVENEKRHHNKQHIESVYDNGEVSLFDADQLP